MNDWIQYEGPHHPGMDELFHQLNLANIANVLYWREFFEFVRSVPGDYVECGVGRGRSLLIVAALSVLLEPAVSGRRKLWAYDSFQGFPEPTPEDRSHRNPKAGEWATSPSCKYRYSPEFIRRVLAEARIPLAPESATGLALTLREGFFRDSLPSHPRQPIALLHLDGDLYQSYMDSLTILFPLVSPGGIVVFDDFTLAETAAEKFPGARRAVREFLGPACADLRVSPRGTPYYVKPR